jgi:hypothetical protein
MNSEVRDSTESSGRVTLRARSDARPTERSTLRIRPRRIPAMDGRAWRGPRPFVGSSASSASNTTKVAGVASYTRMGIVTEPQFARVCSTPAVNPRSARKRARAARGRMRGCPAAAPGR